MSNPDVTHSKLSFSGRSRWSKCAVSVHLSAGVPDVSGPAAEEGTLAHAIAEHYVRQAYGLAGAVSGDPVDVQPPEGCDLKGMTVEAWNEQLRRHGRDYCDYVRSFTALDTGASVTIENKVAAGSIHPQLFGTADCLIWCPATRTLIVVDYKYGFGDVDVGTREASNPQLAAYAVAACETFSLKPRNIILAVYQPRRPGGLPNQELPLPADWLAVERAKLDAEAAAVDAAAGGSATPVPGDHCRYCKGKAKCTATQGAARAALAVHAGRKSLLDMTPEEVVVVWSARTAFKAFWEDIEERVKQLAREGAPGLTTKTTQGRRMWADPKLAALTLLALGRADLVQPVGVTDALPAIPEDQHETLIKRSADSVSIVATDPAKPHEIEAVFAKYTNS